MSSFKEIFPPIETTLDMEPEELAPFVLKHLKGVGKINRYNYTLRGHEELREYAGEHLGEFQRRLMEAFVWLERELFIAPSPDEGGEWRFITRKVKPLFLRGDYETAIFQAFKEVEVRVRKLGKYSNSEYGVDLMRRAFNPQDGPLINTKSEKGEKQAMSDLFAGAIGLFKNPVSHRNIGGISPEEAADIIRFANCLLRMLGSGQQP